MCAIGRALMSDPKLLLLDEPSAGLAPVIVQQVFALVERIRASGLTVLIVEQNVRQVLRVVDRAYLLEAGWIRASGPSAKSWRAPPSSKPISASERKGEMQAFGIFDIYLVEALLNGVLLGGVLALLALGLNLVFGVIDVVWICYAELIMLGMYGMYICSRSTTCRTAAAALICICGSRGLGVVLHLVVIQPLLGGAPINQLLATGGVLFFLQSAATVMFGIDFRNLGIRLPVLRSPTCHSAMPGCWRSAARWPAWWRSISFSPAPIPASRSARSRKTARSCR